MNIALAVVFYVLAFGAIGVALGRHHGPFGRAARAYPQR